MTIKAGGWVSSLDASSGEFKWRRYIDAPVIAGVTPTAGGLLFTGDSKGHLLVFNSETGEILKSIDTRGALAGGVITYQLEDVQYLAISSGNVSRSTFGATGIPSIVIYALDGAKKNFKKTARQPIKASAKNGMKIYSSNCASCHGVKGEGGSGLPLTHIVNRLSEKVTRERIKNPTAPMPRLYPQILSDDDIQDLI